MALNLKKTGALAALFIGVALLAGCKDDGAQKGNSKSAIDIYDTSHVKRDYVITIDDLAFRTATGRELQVTARAYCQELAQDDTPMKKYKQACREIIGQKLMYAARSEDGFSRFEAYPAMDNKTIRPYNYFDEEMMLRAVPKNYTMDLYTVTDVRICGTGRQVAPMPDPYIPHKPTMTEAEARAKQTVTPKIGRAAGPACTF
jgi:hypothetical protein